ncbi:MAG: Flp pilus assembly complex ATPase component TadA [Deltaproteobacteria bacterium]|nr:Flp pilus assembly complex ATPase component TadA [Deltaproteobacteria bacterium]
MKAMQQDGGPQTGPKKRKRLGEFLVEAGLIDEKILSKALDVQKIKKKKLGQVLIDMGVADDEQIAKALSRQFDIPLLRLEKLEIPQTVISLVPAEIAENYLLIPVKADDDGITVAMANPLEPYAVDDLRFVTRMPVRIAVASQREILRAIEKHYPKQGLRKDLDSGPALDEALQVVPVIRKEEEEEEDIRALTERPPVVRFVNAILVDAIKIRASDIHIEPQKTAVIVRYRIDGIMREIMQTDRHVHPALVSRIKIISNMDISIRRKPQDGRCQVRYGERSYDLRVSTIPTSYGEKVAVRILNPESARVGIEDLGLSARNLASLENAIAMPQGLVLVTGPTGSGKSTTLYACLNRLNTPKVNIITVEDPVEFEIKGVNQVQINPKAGITFASGLRSILRQDPDIVMVGEIRDGETASIAFQAAQTGHLVLSTLHTNDAASAVARLLDLGVEAFLISSSLVAVVGQRLVRRICEKCKVPDPPTPQILRRLGPLMEYEKNPGFWKGAGCEACQYTGYAGRLGVYEILPITLSMREVIEPKASLVALRKAAEREGFRSMTVDGISKVLQGLTTIEEVFRVAPPDLEEVTGKAGLEAMVAAEPVPEEVSPNEEERPSLAISRPKKLLVADDSEIIRKILRNCLEAEGFLVLTAEDGVDALKLALTERPDLLVTDLLMPRMDGMALIRKLRSQLATRYIPIIMLTAKDEVDSEVKGMEAGADDYLTKPVDPKRLLARVQRLLDRSAGN